MPKTVLETTTPARWRCDSETLTYDWYGTSGYTTLLIVRVQAYPQYDSPVRLDEPTQSL
jgi:hypothetical protein